MPGLRNMSGMAAVASLTAVVGDRGNVERKLPEREIGRRKWKEKSIEI